MSMPETAPSLAYPDVKEAADRVAGIVRPLRLLPDDPGAFGARQVWLAAEFLQHTGSFKARGAVNFTAALVESGGMPPAGVVVASGGNAGLACAWAARRYGIAATVLVPVNAPAVKVAKLREYGADVRLVGNEYAEALAASQVFAEESGAVPSHAYDLPLIAAGAGTLMMELVAQQAVDTVVVAVGGGGLFAGVAAVAAHHGIRVVAVEPENSRALHAAIAAGRVVDVPVDSIAGDSLGARRVTRMALDAGLRDDVRSVLVPDAAIVEARRGLWEERRIVLEHGAAAAMAALRSGAYQPSAAERVAVVLCGANTDPSDLAVAVGAAEA
jgi:threonine dehydratase